MKNQNDKLILELKKKIEVKKSLLEKSERFQPKTNCALRLHGVDYNLHTVDKPTILFLIASIGLLENSLHNVLSDETLIISGYKTADWIDDLKSKFNILNRRLEEGKLKVLEDRLHGLLTTETRVELEVEQISKLI